MPPLEAWDRCALRFGPFQAAPGDPCPTQVVLTGPQTPVGAKSSPHRYGGDRPWRVTAKVTKV